MAFVTVTYDDHGRVVLVDRKGQTPTTIAYEYNAFGLVSKTFSVNGTPQKYDFLDYDAFGRLRSTVSTSNATIDAAGADAQTFLYFYDGATLDSSGTVPAQQGFLTGIAGAGYEKQFTYFPDGSLQHELLDFGDYALSTDFAYFDSGAVRSQSTQLISAANAQMCVVEQAPNVDPARTNSSREVTLTAQGQPQTLLVNGQPFTQLVYDDIGRVTSALLADGSAISPTYDPVTLAQTGVARFSRDGMKTQSGVTYTARGQIATEVLATASSSTTRAYAYSPEQSLASYTDNGVAAGAFSYDHNSYLQETTGTTYTRDALGRATSRTTATSTANFFYNANGQLSGACTTAGCTTPTIVYTYDESGQRLVRRVSGNFDRAYTDSGVIDANASDGGGITQTVDLAGWHLGTLRKGIFTSLATDARGTVIGALQQNGVSALQPADFELSAPIAPTNNAAGRPAPAL